MSSLQILQAPTELPSQILRHAQAGDHGRFGYAVSVGRDGGERHADDALVLTQFGDEVCVMCGCAPVEYDQPLAIIAFDFADCATGVFRHLRTYKEIWGDAPQDSDTLLLVSNVASGKKRPVVSICGVLSSSTSETVA